ncbi:MAG: hypothetical protein ACYS0H_04665 [Planctomycetota bacterium]|jgi:hypothetical protein
MTRYDIPWEDNYVGVWIGEPSRELRIRKVGPRRYLATLLINGQPIKRPWMNDEPTVDMPATYSFSAMDGSDFSVDLWTNERLAISLNYEPDYQIYDDPPCEALTMGITRDSELDFLDQYYDLLGGMEHFIRRSSNEV